MSQNQRQARQQQQQQQQEEVREQEQIAGVECKKKKNRKRNRKKRSEAANANNNNNLSKDEIETNKASGGDSEARSQGETQTKENKPLNNTMEHNTTPVASRKAAGSNWQAAMGKTPKPQVKNEQESNGSANNTSNNNGENEVPSATTLTKAQRHRQKRRNALLHKYVAMDCEMVGVGLNGVDDMLARVSIVNRRGDVLLDKFVKPQERVIDYRTSVSGVRPHDMANGEDMATVQDEVVQILQNKILIGHGIGKDLSVLRIKHPHHNIRDTAFYKPLRRLMANGRTPSLKRLSQAILGKEIQTGEHSSVEDARAVMSIYNCLASDWEQYIKRHQHKNPK